MPDLITPKRALVSVSDKSGLVAFVRELVALGCEIISTGGTAVALREQGVPVTPIDAVTGFPEIMDGRVKTLHPKVHGGLLGVRDNAEHRAAMNAHGIRPIDLVCVNLYPFEQTVARPGCSREEAVEQIDIGGPSMIRSGAKNHGDVAVVTSPAQYARVVACLSANAGATTLALRRTLAQEAFEKTAAYDAAIAGYLAGGDGEGDGEMPQRLSLRYERAQMLRYGENPHQKAALYRAPGEASGLLAATQLHGKELSFNNIADAQAALALVRDLARVSPGACGAVVVKHTNPCGAAIAPDAGVAVAAAIAGDPVAAYGGIIAVGAPVTTAAAERLTAKGAFFEVVLAPAFEPAALEMLRAKSVNVRLLQVPMGQAALGLDLRAIPGGLLAQERDEQLTPAEGLVLRAGPEPGKRARQAAAFLEVIVRGLFSNAVVLGGEGEGGSLRVFGAGAGQMDRVTSCRLAIQKAGELARGAVCVSDAFFPFADGPGLLVDAGVTTIVHPGGSKRDQDTFDLCTARGVACLTSGLRHFRH